MQDVELEGLGRKSADGFVHVAWQRKCSRKEYRDTGLWRRPVINCRKAINLCLHLCSLLEKEMLGWVA